MARSRSDRITDLGELQLQVFDHLSELGEGTVYSVLDRFPEGRRPRYTTVLTVLRSLEKKGLITHRTEDRAYVFVPKVKPAQVRRQVLRDVVDRVFGGSPRALVSALLSVETVTPEVLEELKTMIAQSEAEREER